MAECRGVNCDFEGTQDEVDDHFVDCIRIGDPSHARMPRGPLPQDLPADFSGQMSVLGECMHLGRQFISLTELGFGSTSFAMYCRDCHICAYWPLPPKCTCGAGDTTPSLDNDGYSLHQEDCPRAYRKPRRHEVRIGDGIRIRIVNGRPVVFIDGELVPEDRITQMWGACRCEQATRARVWHYPGPNHRTNCPRYRRKPFGDAR
jgi:hypothetical protein